jgi:hypothetical protein
MGEQLSPAEGGKPLSMFVPPPTAEEIDRQQEQCLLKEIQKDLQEEANDAFPNRGKSRYHNVNVLLIR